jgi:hypothetical protein
MASTKRSSTPNLLLILDIFGIWEGSSLNRPNQGAIVPDFRKGSLTDVSRNVRDVRLLP